MEARPKGRPEGSSIEGYVVEDHADDVLAEVEAQDEAIRWAKSAGHVPRVARVRHLKDKKFFGGLREAVLKRDRHQCRVCGKPGGRKRSLAVHHRVPGKSELDLMITLCLAHHAMVTRTLVLLADWPELLRVPWREQHRDAHEQTTLSFVVLGPPAQQTSLLDTDRMSHRARVLL